MKGSLMPIQMGHTVKSASIKRSDVAQGCKGRCVLVDPNPRACYIAYDSDNKCAVFVDQESMLEFQLSPRTYYLFLVARLNTDMKGVVVGTEINLEYLRLSDKPYEEFVDALQEMNDFGSIILKLEATSPTFSYVKPVPSKEFVDDEIYNKIDSLKDLEALWSMVIMDAAKTEEQYRKILAEKAGPGGGATQRREMDNSAQGTASLGGRQTRPAVTAGTSSRPSSRPVKSAESIQASATDVPFTDAEEVKDSEVFTDAEENEFDQKE